MKKTNSATVDSAMAAGRGGRRRACTRTAFLRGENMEFGNLAASGELAFALQNGFGGNLHYVITPPI